MYFYIILCVYSNIDMYYYKYNTPSRFHVNKKMSDYLTLYQSNLMKRILKKETVKINIPMTDLQPIDPNVYVILFPLTNMFCFLAGYYSHYFLNK